MQVTLNTRINQELRKNLDIYCRNTGRPITAVVEEALEIYLDERKEDIRQVTQRTLEIIGVMGRLPMSTIDNLAGLQKELREKGYISYLDSSTDWLIVEKEIREV